MDSAGEKERGRSRVKKEEILKDKSERVREAVHLLIQIKDIGFLPTSQGYKDIKAVLDTWINDGHSWSGKVKLIEYGRVADIVLPSKSGVVASMRLRSI